MGSIGDTGKPWPYAGAHALALPWDAPTGCTIPMALEGGWRFEHSPVPATTAVHSCGSQALPLALTAPCPQTGSRSSV